jgi:hypothetical protein
VRRCWFFNPAYEVSRRTPSESISSRFNNARGANPARAVETAPAAARLASGEFPKEEEDRREAARVSVSTSGSEPKVVTGQLFAFLGQTTQF